jgi:hypothetical protein
MTKPQPVKRAITVVSLCIALSVLAALLDRVTGRMSVGGFSFNIVLYGVLVMIPYKLAQRSNATRFVFAVLTAIAILSWLGGASQALPLFSKIVSIVQLPLIVLSIYWLFFGRGTSDWFGRIDANASEDVAPARIEPRL